MYQATSSGPNGVALLNGNRQLAAGLEPWGTIGLGRGMQPWGLLGGTLGATGDTASLMASTGVREYAGGVWSSYQCAACAQAIVDMQTQLQRAAAALGVGGSIKADGVVGDQTLAFAKAVGAAALRRYEYIAEGAGITGAATTKERLARNAIAVADFARSIANRLGAPPVAPPAPTPPKPAPVPTGPTAPAPFPTFPDTPAPSGGGLTTFVKAHWPWFVGGGILAAGALATLAILAVPPAQPARSRR